MNTDRTVHGRIPGGSEVVRYERAGKWYLEHPDGSRCLLTVQEAAEHAARPTSILFPCRPGGRSFDAKVRKIVSGGSCDPGDAPEETR